MTDLLSFLLHVREKRRYKKQFPGKMISHISEFRLANINGNIVVIAHNQLVMYTGHEKQK